VHGGPGAVGPPGLGDLGEGVAGPVLSGDLGVQPGFVPGQAIRCLCATQHNQPGGERPQSLNLLHAPDGLAGTERPQRRAIQQPVQGSPGDRPEILALAAGRPTPGPRRVRGAGNAPSWPWRAINSVRSRAAWLIRSRCDSTVHEAAS
jgi:hypothetical protein